MKLVPPKDLGTIVYPDTWHESTSTWQPSLTRVWAHNNHKHALNFLKSMVNKHAFMNFVSLSKNFNP